jgi:hypothetical protein
MEAGISKTHLELKQHFTLNFKVLQWGSLGKIFLLGPNHFTFFSFHLMSNRRSCYLDLRTQTIILNSHLRGVKMFNRQNFKDPSSKPCRSCGHVITP